jgi:geranylgeranyl reductase
MTEFPVLIAGAGPAGALLAGALARRGIRVLVLERAGEDAATHGWTADIEDSLLREVSPLPKTVGLSSARTARLLGPDGRLAAEFAVQGVSAVRLDRLVELLRTRAIQAGAGFLHGATVLGMEPRGGEALAVRFDYNGSPGCVTAEFVADCTGIASVLRGAADDLFRGRLPRKPDQMLAHRAVYRVDPVEAARVYGPMRVSPGVAVSRVGFRTGYSIEMVHLDAQAGEIDVLAGFPAGPGAGPEEAIRSFLSPLRSLGRQVRGGGGVIPIAGAVVNPVFGRLVVLGDAAGQANPIHSSGVGSAIVASRLAADAIVDALCRGPGALESYSRQFLVRRGAMLLAYDLLRRGLQGLSPAEVSAVLGHLVTATDMSGGIEGDPPSILSNLGTRVAAFARHPIVGTRVLRFGALSEAARRLALAAPTRGFPAFATFLETAMAVARRVV